jgi:hypothetical protein
MPTTIRTEQARVALAHREYRKHSAEHKRRLKIRGLELKRDPRAIDEASFLKLCAEDPECFDLMLSLVCDEVWRDANIENGCVATIEDDGRVRWTLPQYAEVIT